MNYSYRYPLRAFSMALALGAGTAWADPSFEFHGYSRGGPVLSSSDGVTGNFSLGGDLQKFRLGNEGDNGIEIDLIARGKVDNIRWKVQYMPSKWNAGNVGTEQAFVEMGGMPFAPEANIWVGQRRLRLQDVHITDYNVVNYGDHQGVGFTDLELGGGAKLAVGVFSYQKFDAPALSGGVEATRFNVDFSEIPVNPGGTLRVLLTGVNGSKLGNSNSGSGVSLVHNQKDFLVPGLGNALFLQASTGHAGIDGRYESIENNAAGKQGFRIADSLSWQLGAFGGQTLVGYQTAKDDKTGIETRDTSFGGRISYAFSKNFKLLIEGASTGRTFSNGGADQRLDKLTIAPTLALGPDFYSRPELRFYVTSSTWNDAAALANANGFATGNKTARTVAGVQYEVWW